MELQTADSIPKGFEPETNIEVEGPRNFHIKVFVKPREIGWADVTDIRIRLIANRDKKHWATLPVPKNLKVAYFPFDVFDVSPDERTLLISRKVCSGTNEMFLFSRHSNLHYRLPINQSLNEQITRRFGEKSDMWSGGVEFLTLLDWKERGRLAHLRCHYGERSSRIDYTVLLNTHTGTFHDFRRERV